MTYPTPEEIRAAHDAIDRDGYAETMVQFSAVALNDPILSRVVNRLTQAAERGMRVEAAVAAAIAEGLSYGLRIHEQRMAAAAAPDTPESVAEKARAARGRGEMFEGLKKP